MASPYLTSQWNKQKVLWADRSRCPPALRQALLTGTKVACFYPVCKGETHPCGVGLAIAAACHSEHPIKSLAKGQELPALKKNWKSLCDLFTLLNFARLFPWDKNWTLKCHQWNKKVVYLHKKRDQMVVCLVVFFTTFSPHCCCEILWLIIKCLTDCCVCTADWLKLCCVVSSFRALYTGPMGRDQRQSLGSWTRPPGAVPAWLGR